MTITDDRTTPPTPAPTPPSYVRRHPILAGFGVLSGLSLFSALWPVSAIVIAVAIAGHATGLDRAAVLLVERVAARIDASAHHRTHPDPTPVKLILRQRIDRFGRAARKRASIALGRATKVLVSSSARRDRHYAL
jgi:hypothetical protein